MTLLLDIGNTRLKWGCLEHDEVRAGGVTMHKRDVELVLQGWSSEPRPRQVIIVSVAGSQLTNAVLDWIRQHWQLEPGLLRSGLGAEGVGVKTKYRYPERLGADRWAAAVGAYAASKKAVCVVDCGSAITFDAVDSAGRHLGGLIVPGWNLMRSALHLGTADLPFAEADSVELFAMDTTDAIVSGTLLGAAAMVDRLTERMLSGLGPDVELWLTGGDAPNILPHLQLEFRHAPGLVLQGLAVMADSFTD